MGLMKNVNRDTYLAAAKSFMAMKESGFVLCLRSTKDGDLEIPATPREWGAWKAYFHSNGLKHQYFDICEREMRPFTVPARWPNEFAEDATVQGDFQAANEFIRQRDAERARRERAFAVPKDTRRARNAVEMFPAGER